MEGVRILNQTVVMEAASWYIPVIALCLITATASFVIAYGSNNGGKALVGFIISIISVLTYFIVGIMAPKTETDRYRYEAIIDESVPFHDIYEKYDVIEQRGEIWILEDKE